MAEWSSPPRKLNFFRKAILSAGQAVLKLVKFSNTGRAACLYRRVVLAPRVKQRSQEQRHGYAA